MPDREIYEIYDRITKNIDDTMRLQDFLVLYSLADRGWFQLMKAIKYAYKLGVKYGSRKAAR